MGMPLATICDVRVGMKMDISYVLFIKNDAMSFFIIKNSLLMWGFFQEHTTQESIYIFICKQSYWYFKISVGKLNKVWFININVICLNLGWMLLT